MSFFESICVGDSKYATDSWTRNSSLKTFNIGFRPTYLCVLLFNSSNTLQTIMVYNAEKSTTQYIRANTSSYASMVNLGNTGNNYIRSINDDGFSINTISSGWNGKYIAVKRG